MIAKFSLIQGKVFLCCVTRMIKLKSSINSRIISAFADKVWLTPSKAKRVVYGTRRTTSGRMCISTEAR